MAGDGTKTETEQDMVVEDESRAFDLDAVDWQDVNDEVDAAMMESDSDESDDRPSPSGTANEVDEASPPSHELILLNG